MEIAVATLVAYGEAEVADNAEQETSRVILFLFWQGYCLDVYIHFSNSSNYLFKIYTFLTAVKIFI